MVPIGCDNSPAIYHSHVVVGDWQPHVPAVTVGAPRIADDVVRRSALVNLLRGAGAGDLVAVSAPAGYGKSTAVALWDAADPRSFAWVRIDHLDNDPTHLLLHIATAVERVYPVDRTSLRYLRGPGRAPLTELIPEVVRILEACGPIIIVLDDVHELSSPDVLDTLRGFVDAVPDTATVALVGRGPLPLDLARRRVQHRVVKIGIDDLRYTAAEAAAVLARAGGPSDPASVALIVDKCEGWPAGVALVAMALEDGAAVESFSIGHSVVADYLVEEVLNQLDRQLVVFLMESAVLDRFDSELLDAVLGRSDSRDMLEKVRQSGIVFLISLDTQCSWYRYHHLFGDLLRDRLRAHDGARLRELAARAADQLELDGDIDAALGQAVAADDRSHAAALVGRDAVQLGFDGRAGVLRRRLALLDDRTFVEYPDAAIARAWLGITTGDAALIQGSLLLAGRADRGLPLADGTPSVKVAVALASSLVGVGGVHEVIRYAEMVRGAGDHLVNPWWGAATVMMGAAHSMLGDAVVSRTLLESALPVIDDLPGFHAAALAHLALLDLGAGDDEAAVAASTAARSIVDCRDLNDVVPMVVVYAVSAVIAARMGDVSGARDAAAITDKLLRRLGRLAARTSLLGHGLLAWTAAVLEDDAAMHRHLEAAERLRRLEPEALALCQRVDRVRAMATRGSRPMTAAELRLLPHLATHRSLQHIADELRLGRETVKSQASSIYRKLGVSSREAAVTEARQIGLLAM